jgi:hypothetical protein
MRLFQVILVTAAFLAASVASAIELAVTSSTVGNDTTIEISLTNVSASTVQGIEIDLTGLAGKGNLTSGSAAKFNFVAFCANPTTCFGGVDSVQNAFFDYNNLTLGGYTPGDNLVELLRSLSLNPTTQTGALDPGIGGNPNVDIRAVVTATSAGNVTINARYSNGVDVITFATQNVAVPEPGALAASLASLATVGSLVAVRRRLA